ncbi:hypothetical protein B0H63DRAFT_476005 [Podospora didyma]|uniref:C2H2-type domain-containing protein n=1 Tax=Podospora didyma TaxID=330526 RepID=A0AAE0NHG2_9PEZI|nr:hypothetical protein B0H63DRAFT_476005 [Podospora didyma]
MAPTINYTMEEMSRNAFEYLFQRHLGNIPSPTQFPQQLQNCRIQLENTVNECCERFYTKCLKAGVTQDAYRSALHFLVQDFLGSLSAHSKFPQELLSEQIDLKRYIGACDAEIREKCLISSKSLPWLPCHRCAFSSHHSDTWWNHLLTHERVHEEEWHVDNSVFRLEPRWFKSHWPGCIECRGWDNSQCHRPCRNQQQVTDCSRCRCARMVYKTMTVRHACGFCTANQVFTRWNNYRGHLREHYKTGASTSEWSNLRVMYALICGDNVLYDALSKDLYLSERDGPLPKDWKADKNTLWSQVELKGLLSLQDSLQA